MQMVDVVQWWADVLHTQRVHIHHNKIEFTVQVYQMYSAVCFPIPCKTGVVPVHSENDGANQ